MKPFDDRIPEEVEPQHKELMALLHRAYRIPIPVSSIEQAQIIANVRERLLLSSTVQEVIRDRQHLPVSSQTQQYEDQDISPSEDMPVQQGLMTGTTLQKDKVPASINRRGSRIAHILNTLAAILVIGVIIGASLLLFTHRPQSTGTNASTPNLVRSEAGGLEISLSLTPGPYFLSEIIATDVSLTNRTQTTFSVGWPFVESACGYSYDVMMTGGGKPYYMIPIATDHSCPPSFRTTPLRPGQTLTVHKFLPLTSSGQVTLTTEARFFKAVDDKQGFQIPTPITSPLDGHWPSLQINVNPAVSADHKLSFGLSGSHVIVISPPAARSHLLYLYGVFCSDFQGQGSTGSGNYGWEPLSGNEVNEPGCPGKNVQWSFAFGAPGYAIVTGSYPVQKS